jgi:precorrin-6B methylase 2
MSPADQTARQAQPVRIAAMGLGARALALALSVPGIAIDVFERDWRAIDRLRNDADRQGLAQRVHIHHTRALELTDPAAYALLINGETKHPV